MRIAHRLTGVGQVASRTTPQSGFQPDRLIDGGGEMAGTAGGFTLCGTVARPDAGAMTSGDFKFRGGY